MVPSLSDQILPPPELARRSKRIRLNKLELSALCGLSEKQTGQILRGQSNARLDSIRVLQGAVIGAELEMLVYLLDLHGVPDSYAAGGTHAS